MPNTMHPPGGMLAYAAAFGLLVAAWLLLSLAVTNAAMSVFEAVDERRGHPRPAPSPQQAPAPREVRQ